MCSRLHLSFCERKTAWLAPETLVSMGPSPHLWFLDAKQRLLDQNNMSLWVPALICGFWMQNSDFWTRITSLNESQTSPVVLCMQYSVICTGMTRLYGFQPSSVVLCLQNSDLRPRIAYLYGSQTSPLILWMQNGVPSIRMTSLCGFQPWNIHLCMQNGAINTWITSLYVSLPSSVVFACKTGTFGPELQVSMGPRPSLSFCAWKTSTLGPDL